MLQLSLAQSQDLNPMATEIDCRGNKLIEAAFRLAEEVHAGQTRKGKNALPYMTHPIRGYNILASCLPAEGYEHILAAELLHDVIENYRTEEGEDNTRFRPEIIEKIRESVGDKVLTIVQELTNPPDWKDKAGATVEGFEPRQAAKRIWQVEQAWNMSLEAKLVKIADQVANIISDIEEVPVDWRKDKRLAYIDKCIVTVEACMENFDDGDSALIVARKRLKKGFDRVAETGRKVLNVEGIGAEYDATQNSLAAVSLPLMQAYMQQDETGMAA